MSRGPVSRLPGAAAQPGPTRLPPLRRSAGAGLSPEGAQRVGDDLLSTVAAVRRTSRRQAGRPAELESLTGAELELVRLLRRNPGISVARAAAELRLAPNTVSTLVGQLTDAGLARRRPDGTDRRVARLDLSPEVRRRTDAWRDRRVVALGAAIGRLAASDQDALVQALPVMRRLSELLEDGPGQ